MPKRSKKSSPPSHSAQTYWILRPDQIACLTSSKRQSIVDWLVAAGPCSVREFAGPVGIAPSAAYHHLEKLEAVGLIAEAGTRVVRRKTERLYAAVAPRMRLARALESPKTRPLMKPLVASMCRQMSRDFAAALGSDRAVASGSGRNLGFFRLVAAPNRTTLAEVNRHLGRIAELLWAGHSDSAPSIALSWTMNPVGPKSRRTPTRKRRRTR